jgi:hypothetical protein
MATLKEIEEALGQSAHEGNTHQIATPPFVEGVSKQDVQWLVDQLRAGGPVGFQTTQAFGVPVPTLPTLPTEMPQWAQELQDDLYALKSVLEKAANAIQGQIDEIWQHIEEKEGNGGKKKKR